jgi:hypothetical protein
MIPGSISSTTFTDVLLRLKSALMAVDFHRQPNPESQITVIMKKTFLLCPGCQKGGTTWLHDYLHNHPGADFGFTKEYKILDKQNVKFLKKMGIHARQFTINGLRKLPSLNDAGFRDIQRIDLLTDLDNYFNYFWWTCKDSIRLTGDISPSYCSLTSDTYKEAKRRLQSNGFSVKLIFLMRDPVERIISATRMHRRSSRLRFLKKILGMSEDFDVLKTCRKTPVEIRTRYEVTISEIEQAFAPEDIYYGFYENLFNEQTIKEITDFISVDYRTPNFKKKINHAQSKQEISTNTRLTIFNHYRPTYEFVANKFGSESITRFWPSYREFMHK